MGINFRIKTRPNPEYPTSPMPWLFDTEHLAFGEFDDGEIEPYAEADINELLVAHVGSWMVPMSSCNCVIVPTKREAIATIEEAEGKICRLGGVPFLQALRLDGKRDGYFQLARYSFLGEELIDITFYNA